MARSIRERIKKLKREVAENRNLLTITSQLYTKRVQDSGAAIQNPDGDFSTKRSAFNVAFETRDFMLPLIKRYERTEERLAQEVERSQAHLLLIEQHRLTELGMFRAEHNIGIENEDDEE